MKNIGIWLDSKKALIVTINENGDSLNKIDSQIDFYNRTSTGGSRVKWGGTQDITDEQNYLEKEKQQFKKYFKEVANAISDCDALAIFGPADINEKLKKELENNYPAIGRKIVAVEKADSMTDNQTRALIRDFFNNR
ncbi:hypothetical protein [Maribacter cobaltidurans]|uniref:Uncharacterized protein n=1 Tax=Maribacter cobaltidurans TaxID=1178778 RepID=A0A223V5V2_9FLAO|nr:hypothetical protein [Maribacter cobaltidurans]ASV30791.1 hypothetical protein CJ263_11510 [Maribacter cobaltidurans]GGD81799.1 hypothetical protein GCM10011412_19470 [Maribacter cobaltidurans]